MQRLAVALSAAALVVALLGATPLGEAARDAVKAGVKSASAKSKASRGPRGPRGYRGPRGFQGPPGETSPSNAYDFKSTTPVTINGSTPELATTVASPATPLGAGKYTVAAQVAIDGSTDGTVFCRGREGRPPGQSGLYYGQPASVRVGSATPTATLTLSFSVDLPQATTVTVACWETGGTGATAGPAELVFTQVGNLTAIS